jgi:hypothetical protein
MINLEKALHLAREEFRRRVVPAMGVKAGVRSDLEGRLVVPLYGREYALPVRDGEDVAPAVEILLLHYVTRASGLLPEGEKVSFKELPGGFIYNVPFTNRVIRPLVATFGKEPPLLLRAGERLGGKPVPFGDAAVELPALPRVPVTFIVWGGDAEFPPNGSILFDGTVPGYLSTEDCVVLAQMGMGALRAALKTLS